MNPSRRGTTDWSIKLPVASGSCSLDGDDRPSPRAGSAAAAVVPSELLLPPSPRGEMRPE